MLLRIRLYGLLHHRDTSRDTLIDLNGFGGMRFGAGVLQIRISLDAGKKAQLYEKSYIVQAMLNRQFQLQAKKVVLILEISDAMDTVR